MIRTVFLGTPASAVPALTALTRVSEVQLVVTPPDRPAGRGSGATATPVRQAAEGLSLPLAYPTNRDELEAALSSVKIDLGVVVAFGMLLSQPILDLPAQGMVNMHFSLLPRWRGASPVERAILAGDESTGVTMMQMNAGLDTGPILASWETSVGADEDAGTLTNRLAAGGSDLLEQTVAKIAAGEAMPTPQDNTDASYAHKLSTAEARLDFSRPAKELVRMIRAFNPRPGAHTTWRDERFKVHSARVVSDVLDIGTLGRSETRVLVGTASTALSLGTVQPSGSQRMPALDWVRGVKGELGALQ